jgi:hypothetical protein
MPYFQLDNIYWEYQLSAAKTFKSYLDSNKRYLVVLPDLKQKPYPNESFDQTILNARAAAAGYFIIGKLKSHKDAMVISMEMYNTSDSSRIWCDSLIARTTYDLDPALRLFAQYIGTEKIASKEYKNFAVTYFYPKELVKVDATFNYGVEFCGIYTNVDRGNKKFSRGFGFLISYDKKRSILDIQGDYFPGNYHHCILQFFDIRATYLHPLKTTKSTPLVGGSLAYSIFALTYPNPNPKSYFTEENEWGTGLAIFINAGYLFKRNSIFNYRLTGSFYYSFFKAETEPFNKILKDRPLGFIVNAAIQFHKKTRFLLN